MSLNKKRKKFLTIEGKLNLINDRKIKRFAAKYGILDNCLIAQ